MALDAGAIQEALAGAVARADFNLMRAIINSSFPLQSVDIDDLQVIASKLGPQAVETAKIKLLNITAALLATDAVETAKIKDLNVTKGKAELGFGRYVPRYVDLSGDWTEASGLTMDAAWHVNGLDCAAKGVSAGAKAIHFVNWMTDDAANTYIMFRQNAVTPGSVFQLTMQVANISAGYRHGIIHCDSDRLIDYAISAGIASFTITIAGWFM